MSYLYLSGVTGINNEKQRPGKQFQLIQQSHFFHDKIVGNSILF